MTTKTYLSIYLPLWPIDVVRRRLRERASEGDNGLNRPGPYALVSSDTNHVVVKRACAECARAGVRTGMDLALARALLPTVIAHPFDPRGDVKALTELARWMGRFSPLVGLDPELHAPILETKKTGRESDLFTESLRWGVIVDLTGTERLHGETEALMTKLLNRFAHVGVTASTALAPTLGGAWALARFGGQSIVRVSDTTSLRTSLALLPIEALRLPITTRTALHEVGVTRIGELLKIPPRTLTVRFGHLLLNRLDQALGRVEESFRALSIPTIFRATARFDVPVTHHTALERTIVRLTQKLLERLSRSGYVARTFFIYLEGRTIERTKKTVLKTVNLATGSTAASHLTSVIAPIIESITFDEGANLIVVAAENIERAIHAQNDFLADPEATIIEAARGELLNTLVVRLGEEGVRRAEFHPSYVPERSFSFAPIRAEGKDPFSHSGTTSLVVDRPPHLFSPPEPAKVIAMLPDKPPSWIEWRRNGGKILFGSGPERIAPEWWHNDVTSPQEERDYFKVQTETGAWLWVFRNNHTHEWFVHGVWV